jgi:hypothetical protein
MPRIDADDNGDDDDYDDDDGEKPYENEERDPQLVEMAIACAFLFQMGGSHGCLTRLPPPSHVGYSTKPLEGVDKTPQAAKRKPLP